MGRFSMKLRKLGSLKTTLLELSALTLLPVLDIVCNDVTFNWCCLMLDVTLCSDWLFAFEIVCVTSVLLKLHCDDVSGKCW